MNDGGRICEFVNELVSNIRDLAGASTILLGGPNSDLFDLADDLVIRGTSGEVERCFVRIRKGIDCHTGGFNTTLQDDDVKRRERISAWEKRWLAKMKEMREKEEQERQLAEILARVQAVHQRLEAKHGGWFRATVEAQGRPTWRLVKDEDAETFIPMLFQHISEEDFNCITRYNEMMTEAFRAMTLAKTVVDQPQECLPVAMATYRVVQNSERFLNDVPSEAIAATLKVLAATELVFEERALAAAAAKRAEPLSEAPLPPVDAMQATDATDATERPPPAETTSARRFKDDGSGSGSVEEGDELDNVERAADGDVSVAEERDEGSLAAEETREEDAGPAFRPSRDGGADGGKASAAEDPVVVEEVRAESPTCVRAEPRPPPRRAVRPPPRDRRQQRLGDTSRARAVGGFRGFVAFFACHFSRVSTALAELFAPPFPMRIKGKKTDDTK